MTHTPEESINDKKEAYMKCCKSLKIICFSNWQQESPAVADKPARRLRKVRTVYVRAVGL